MTTIHYQFADGHFEDIEVTEEFAEQYEELVHKQMLVERKETRRHQSLDKSMEHGFDIADPHMDVSDLAELAEDRQRIHTAMLALTDKQRAVVMLHVEEKLSFREIGEQLDLGRYTVRDYFYNAVKKLQKLLR